MRKRKVTLVTDLSRWSRTAAVVADAGSGFALLCAAYLFHSAEAYIVAIVVALAAAAFGIRGFLRGIRRRPRVSQSVTNSTVYGDVVQQQHSPRRDRR
jgi:hypothetical protein